MARSRAGGSSPRGRSGRAESDESAERTVVEGESTVRLPDRERLPTASASVSVAVGEALARSRAGQPTLTLPRRGAAATAPAAEGRYEDQGEIGRGGMGSVHRTLDRVLLRAVAMKLIEPGLGPDAVARFVEEAQITGQLDHPNIVPVYEFGRLGGEQAYFTMKLVSGRTLSEVIRELQRAELASEELERVLRILLKVCEAVAFAHSRGVVHRDLKPDNIMIGSHGQVYVMDWGLGLLTAGQRALGAEGAPPPAAGAVTTSVPPPGERSGIEGTVPYMAPEQAAGRLAAVDVRTDVFALGAILYEVLTGGPPYQARTLLEGLARAVEAQVVPPQERVGSRPLPPGLCEIAMRALRRDPAERYQSVEELHAALESFLRGGGWFATRRFEPGAVIVREGEAADAAYVIVEGHCEVYRGGDGRKRPLRTLGPGDVFGETALLSAEPRSATVAASDAVTVKVVTAEAFRREVERSSWLAALMRQLARRFLELERGQAGE